jgi:hypothetical protein
MTYNLDYTMQLRYVRATARYSFTLYRVPLALRSGGANGTPCNKSYPDILYRPLVTRG